jgi:hypothetical protein
MRGSQTSSWAKSVGTALGFILGGAVILLVQNGMASSKAEAPRSAAAPFDTAAADQAGRTP